MGRHKMGRFDCAEGIKFQFTPEWIEHNFQNNSDAVYHTSVAIKMLSNIYFCNFQWKSIKIAHILNKIKNQCIIIKRIIYSLYVGLYKLQ